MVFVPFGWVNLPKGSLMVTLVTGPESYSGNLAYASKIIAIVFFQTRGGSHNEITVILSFHTNVSSTQVLLESTDCLRFTQVLHNWCYV